MENLSLIIFTVLSQIAIGTYLCYFVLDTFLGKVEEKGRLQTLLGCLAIGFVGMIASLFHLGHPMIFFHALFNVGSSWLSREVLFFGVFLALLIVSLIVEKKKLEKFKKPVGALTCLIGIIAAVSTALIYTIPSIPLWNGMSTLFSFLLTALLIGVPLSMTLSGAWKEYGGNAARVLAVIAIVALIVTFTHVSILSGGVPAAVQSAALLKGSALFWIRAVLLACGVVLAGYVGLKKKSAAANVFYAMFAIMAVAEFLGRFLFYTSIVRL